MSRWDVQDGLIHFVFANEDAYVLDSMVVLNLTDKLYYELRRRQYEKILFLEGLKGEYTIRLFDLPSWQLCFDRTKKKLGGSYMIRENFRPLPTGQEFSCNAEQIEKLVCESENTAFVFMLQTFSGVFHGRERLISNLLQTNSQRKNLILIRAGIVSEDSKPILTRPDGIFLSRNMDRPLFPEVGRAFLEENYMDEDCYDRLNDYMNNRCVFLNRFSKKAILRVVRYVSFMLQKNGDRYSDAELEKIARFVWLWYHEEAVQNAYLSLFSENEERKFSVLARDLKTNWNAITEAISEAVLTGMDSRHIHEPFVISHNLPEKELQSIRVRTDEMEKKYGAVIRRLVRDFQKPRQETISPEAQRRLDRFIARMKEAVIKDDYETFERSEKAIRYTILCRFHFGDDNRLNWEGHERILESSAKLFEMEATVRQFTEKIRRFQEEQDRLYTRIQNRSYTSGQDEQDSKEKYVHLVKSEIPRQELLRADVMDQIRSCRHILQNLESGLALNNRISANDMEISALLGELEGKLKEQRRDPVDLYSYDFTQTVKPLHPVDYDDPDLFDRLAEKKEQAMGVSEQKETEGNKSGKRDFYYW